MKASTLMCLTEPFPAVASSSAEFMPVGSEREEELQEARGVPQLETRLQHGSEHVRPAQVGSLAGQCSHSLILEEPQCC